MEIDFYDIQLRGQVADAQYFITDEKGIANVQQQISRKQLLNFVIENDLNLFYPESGYVQWRDPETFLDENYFETIKRYVVESYAN